MGNVKLRSRYFLFSDCAHTQPHPTNLTGLRETPLFVPEKELLLQEVFQTWEFLFSFSFLSKRALLSVHRDNQDLG